MLVILWALGLSVLLLAVVWLWRKRRHRIQAPWLIPEAKQHAIVLAHGILGFDHLSVLGTQQHYFRGIGKHLQEHGAVVRALHVSPLGSVPERAEALASFVKDIDERRVVIVAHSMGGLDARYALSKLGLHHRVRAMVSIGTPHRGTVLAEAAKFLPARALRNLLGQVGVQTEALDWLGEESAKAFARDVPNVSSVFYASVIGETSRMQVLANPLLLATYEVLLRMRGQNDGIVPASSQVWGTELCRVPAHHFAQIGWSPLFDACAMYLEILQALEAQNIACLPSMKA